MGQMIATTFADSGDLEVVAVVDPQRPTGSTSATWCASIDELSPDSVDVVVDFSNLAVAERTLGWCLAHGVAVVVGTSGLGGEALTSWSEQFFSAGGHALVAANFSIGAVLAERFAAQAAPYFDRVEIVEMHHDQKVDAPSGTSMATARQIAAARRRAGLAPLVDPTQRESIPHARGADGGDGVRIHSVRLPGLVAHQETMFARPGEGLTIRHDSYDRESFMSGVTLAVRSVRARPGLTVGIDELV